MVREQVRKDEGTFHEPCSRAESPTCDSLGWSGAEPQVTRQTDISSPERAKRGSLGSWSLCMLKKKEASP